MFKRNQVEEAIACVLEPGSARPSSEMRTRLRRLLETDRALGRSKCSGDPERANFAFSVSGKPVLEPAPRRVQAGPQLNTTHE